MPKLIIFDLDGTLSQSKQPISKEMGMTLSQLLLKTKVAIISGGKLEQLLTQVVPQLDEAVILGNLFLLPTSGTALYEYRGGELRKIYEEHLSETDRREIEEAVRAAAKETGIIDFSKPVYGDIIEYRGSQVTLSALGQIAPLAEKKTWDPTRKKRELLQIAITKRLPDFAVAIGGTTSIDITRKGLDKAYGVRKLCEHISINESEALYVGDELEEGGNDSAVFKTKVMTKKVKNPEETLATINALLTNASIVPSE